MRGSATHTVLPKEGGGTKGRCAGRQRREVEPHEPHGQATDHMPSVIESASLAANRSFACASELSPYWTVATFVLKMCYENSCERCLFEFSIWCVARPYYSVFFSSCRRRVRRLCTWPLSALRPPLVHDRYDVEGKECTTRIPQEDKQWQTPALPTTMQRSTRPRQVMDVSREWTAWTCSRRSWAGSRSRSTPWARPWPLRRTRRRGLRRRSPRRPLRSER